MNDRLRFTVREIGFRPCIVLGGYTVAEIPFALARLDVDGRLVNAIVDAMNDCPELATNIVEALFPTAPAPTPARPSTPVTE